MFDGQPRVAGQGILKTCTSALCPRPTVEKVKWYFRTQIYPVRIYLGLTEYFSNLLGSTMKQEYQEVSHNFT